MKPRHLHTIHPTHRHHPPPPPPSPYPPPNPLAPLVFEFDLGRDFGVGDPPPPYPPSPPPPPRPSLEVLLRPSPPPPPPPNNPPDEQSLQQGDALATMLASTLLTKLPPAVASLHLPPHVLLLLFGLAGPSDRRQSLPLLPEGLPTPPHVVRLLQLEAVEEGGGGGGRLSARGRRRRENGPHEPRA